MVLSIFSLGTHTCCTKILKQEVVYLIYKGTNIWDVAKQQIKLCTEFYTLVYKWLLPYRKKQKVENAFVNHNYEYSDYESNCKNFFGYSFLMWRTQTYLYEEGKVKILSLIKNGLQEFRWSSFTIVLTTSFAWQMFFQYEWSLPSALNYRWLHCS